MLVIRLARTGRNKYPTYRIVAAESARPTTGKFVAILGHYNPHTKELVIKSEEIKTYISHGAQPSNTVIKLLKQEKIELPDWAKFKTKSKAPKKTPEPAETKASPDTNGDSDVAEPAEAADASVAETAAAEDAKTEDQSVNKAEAGDEGAMPTAASEEAETEAAEHAEDVAAEVAIEAPQDDAKKPATEA